MTYRSEIKQGTSVVFSAHFLRSIMTLTGDMPQDRGTVLSMYPVGDNAVCTVRFDIQGESQVLASNLWPFGIPESD